EKTPGERFAGAERTFTIEGMMRDGRALQAGTSHFMGTNFAAAFGITYTGESGTAELCHTTSWGMSTRMIGGLIMTHGDDKGLVLPPAVAPHQVVIVPIGRGEQAGTTLPAAAELAATLQRAGIRTHVDDRPQVSPGFKFNDWEMRGVPVRIEIGPRDVAARNAVLARRDRSGKEGKVIASFDGLAAHLSALLDDVQKSLYTQARDMMRANTREFDDYAKFRAQMEGEGGGGIADIYWCGSAACETRIREETRATCRAIPLGQSGAAGRCLVCGEAAKERAFFAKAY
ncbi:MAG: His/Gly/Thr/Pro-type tRNA ligase C-terminal domain-containing protein, partial [Candidatus Binataceae bacterium]